MCLKQKLIEAPEAGCTPAGERQARVWRGRCSGDRIKLRRGRRRQGARCCHGATDVEFFYLASKRREGIGQIFHLEGELLGIEQCAAAKNGERRRQFLLKERDGLAFVPAGRKAGSDVVNAEAVHNIGQHQLGRALEDHQVLTQRLELLLQFLQGLAQETIPLRAEACEVAPGPGLGHQVNTEERVCVPAHWTTPDCLPSADRSGTSGVDAWWLTQQRVFWCTLARKSRIGRDPIVPSFTRGPREPDLDG